MSTFTFGEAPIPKQRGNNPYTAAIGQLKPQEERFFDVPVEATEDGLKGDNLKAHMEKRVNSIRSSIYNSAKNVDVADGMTAKIAVQVVRAEKTEMPTHLRVWRTADAEVATSTDTDETEA